MYSLTLSKFIHLSGLKGSGYITKRILDQNIAKTGNIDPAKTEKINPNGIKNTGLLRGMSLKK